MVPKICHLAYASSYPGLRAERRSTMPALERSLCSTSKPSATTCSSGLRSRCSHENLRGSGSSTRCTANHTLGLVCWSRHEKAHPFRACYELG
jgi:hypothetical protein